MTGDEELERRLAAYADARLRPDPSSAERTRSAVMAHAEHALRAGAGRVDAPVPPASPMAPAVLAHRRRAPIFALIAAAVLVAVAVGAAAALTGPGQPFYQARLWVESNTLPADPAAREAAQLARLQTRLDEAHAALQRAHPDAAADALAAYTATLDALAADPSAGVGVRDRVEAALTNHIAVLNGLLDQVPPATRGAIQSAIDRSSEALQTVEAGGGNGSPGPGAGSGSNGGNGNASPGPAGGNGSPGPAGGNGNASPGPAGGGSNAQPSPTPRPSSPTKPGQGNPSPGPSSPKP
jgi:hypothetical protein